MAAAAVTALAATPANATVHHPFYDITQSAFVDASHLQPGDELQSTAGATTQITAIRQYQATTTTYDLTINSLHTYYVLAGTTPILVHNTNLPTGCGPNGEPIYDVPGGSSGGFGMGKRIPPGLLQDYDVGVNAAPGSITPLCSYCRTNPATAIDHVEPRINGGDLIDPNVTQACPFCNSSKRDRIAPLNPPPTYTGIWPPPWWPSRMTSP